MVAVQSLLLGIRIIVPRPAPPGSVEELFSQIEVGMTQQQAVALYLGCENGDYCFSNGITKDGSSFGHIGSKPLSQLPPPQEILCCVLLMGDTDGFEVKVTIGPGGVVTRKRFTAPDIWTHLHRRLFGHPTYYPG
jgi:hypothetical protein